MITGKDPISLQVLAAFQTKQPLARIAEAFNLSLDQVKRLKRFYNYTNSIQSLTHEQTAERFKSLGTKGLFLAPYIQAENAEALVELLALTTEHTTRGQLLTIMAQYEAKCARIHSLSQALEAFHLRYMEQEADIKEKQASLSQAKARLHAKFQFVSDYAPPIQELLLYYVGVTDDGLYGLRRRLDSGFRKALQKKNIIRLNDAYVWEILLVHDFAKALTHRFNHGRYIKWDYELEMHRMRNNERGASYVPLEEDYKAIRNFTEELHHLEKAVQTLETDHAALLTEQSQLQAELAAVQKASVFSFEEASRARNELSARELLRHNEMQTIAMKWLYQQGYVVATEVVLPNKKRVDVIGYNDKEVMIIEIKSSRQDYVRDQKWTDYLPYCDTFYFFLDFPTEQKEQVGYIETHDKTLAVVQPDQLTHACQDRQEVAWLIGRTLAKKATFGWV